jgi:hypothetical protein
VKVLAAQLQVTVVTEELAQHLQLAVTAVAMVMVAALGVSGAGNFLLPINLLNLPTNSAGMPA